MANVAEFTATLLHEHHEIEKVVAVMSTIADDLEHWRLIEAPLFHDMTAFLQLFASECQRGLEENKLFTALASKCSPASGFLLPQLSYEHNRAEFLTRDLVESAEAYVSSGGARKGSVIEDLRRLASLYQRHLWKEDHILLPMAEEVLTKEQQTMLFQAFNDAKPNVWLDELAAKIAEESSRRVSHLGQILT